MLIDGNFRGSPRKMLTLANRNGFFYVLDRTNGQFLAGKAFAKVTWAKGLDDSGRPIVVPDTAPTPQGVPIYPGVHGGTNWTSPTYNPNTRLEYIAAREEPTEFYRSTAEFKEGVYYVAGGIHGIPALEPHGSVKALDPATGEQKWEFPLFSPPWAGLLSTAGGLVFGGTNEGNIFALDAFNGKPLWNFQAGASGYSSPMSYEFEGKQYIAITAGRSLIAFTVE
jgi:alcohol dehydrogenase (cytochrome c)